MSILQTVTEQDLSKIREKVYKADRKRRTHHKRAKLIATFGHIGFCLGLLLAGTYIFFMMIGSKVEDGVVSFPQWYDSIGQTIRGFVPAFAADTILEFVFVAVIALICSFVFALLAKLIGLFIRTKLSGKWVDVQSDVEDAKRLRSAIQYNQKYFKVKWDEYYPNSDHMINLYNFIPWLSFIASFVIGFVVFTTTESKEDFLAMVMVIPLLFLCPIALLWRLSAIIDSLLYCGDSKNGFYIELSQLNKFLAPYDEEEKKRIEEEKKRKEAEEREKAAEKAARTAANRRAAAEKRDQALDAESRGLYSLAKSLFREAAEMGDALAMDNYARHCLINGDRSEAIRWLKKCINTGEAGSECKELLRTLEYGGHVDAKYGF